MRVPFTPNNKQSLEKIDLSQKLSSSMPVDTTSQVTKGTLGDWTVLYFSAPAEFAEVQVPSSSVKGEYYGVVVSKTGLTCHCKGFEFRQSCKHVIAVRDKLSESQKLEGDTE